MRSLYQFHLRFVPMPPGSARERRYTPDDGSTLRRGTCSCIVLTHPRSNRMHTHPTSRPVRFRSLVGIALLLALAALASLAGGANAGTQVPQIDFRILKLDCAEDPGQVPDGVTPEGCTPVEGVSFTIDVEDGDTLSCTTNDEGRCQVQVPSEANVIVTEDESTGTEGYTPRENPIETQAVTEFAVTVLEVKGE
jgi:hypothetical protein